MQLILLLQINEVLFKNEEDRLLGIYEVEENIQKVYVSLTVGRIVNIDNSSITNVISYNDLMTLTNEHSKVVKGADVVATDVSQFSQTIKDIISAN